MADTIEEKWPKTLVGCIVFVFILILGIATLIPNRMIDNAIVKEHEMGRAMLSTAEMESIIAQTDSIYTALMIDSGLKEGAADLFFPSPDVKTVNSFDTKVSWWFRYLAERGQAVQKITYMVVYRCVLTLHWLPFFVVVAIPAVVAGFMRWQAKRYGFDYASPFLNQHAVNLLVWGVIVMVVSVLVPLPLPPLVACTILIAVMPSIIALFVSNLPKRI
ncbi:DUF4400 domain-containing protein [Pseudomonas neustonica]|uniref:DUF4400 domain-containing protein n=1 Tax=Pseudomonas neustonica TaxID=2487346 RepID=UPI003F47139F